MSSFLTGSNLSFWILNAFKLYLFISNSYLNSLTLCLQTAWLIKILVQYYALAYYLCHYTYEINFEAYTTKITLHKEKLVRGLLLELDC